MVFSLLRLIFLSDFLTKASKESCENAYKEIVSGDYKHGLNLIYNSGRDLNDLGLYDDCLNISNARYFLLVTKLSNMNQVLGLCAPIACTSEDLVDLSKDLSNYYKGTQIGHYFNKPTIKDSEKYNNRELSGSAFAFVLVLVVYSGVLITSTFIEYLSLKYPESEIDKKFETLLIFSLIGNWKKFMHLSESKSNTQALNGLKVLSMLMICLAHMYVYYGSGPVINLRSALKMMKSFRHRPVYSGIYSVDVFFMIGGFLLAYHSMSHMNRNGGKMSWGVFYLHRAIRILPLYMVATYFYIFLFPYLGFGPAWYLYEHSTEVGCSDYWWSNFVLLNNFLPTSEYSCMSWSWYIACDMQFYLLSPLLLLLQYHKKLYGYLTCALLILANFICLIVQGSVNDYLPGASGGLMNEEQFTQIYIKPYDRMGAYIIGITLGFLIVDFERVKNKPKEQVEIELGSINYEDKTSEPLINHKKTWEYKAVAWVHVKKFRIIAMAGGIALILAMICLPYNYDQHGGDYWPKWFRVLFLASEHIGFTVGLAGFTLPLVFGYGGIFYDVLAHDFFALTSKICFAFYLVHPMWIVFSCMNTPQGIYFEDIFILFRFFGIVLLSVVSAVLLYLIVECPVAKLEKKMMAWIKNRIGT